MTLVYIVIDARIDDGYSCGYRIDSVWTSQRKAQKVCNKLNEELEKNPVWGVGLYEVKQHFIQTNRLLDYR